ncbi:MAG: hydantoinase/oxoprolinase N-terminal domain-containing protein [Thermomicrobiales bacterium]
MPSSKAVTNTTDANRPLGEEAIREAAESLRERVDSVAVVSVFSPVDASHEERAAEILTEVLGDLPMTHSYEIGNRPAGSGKTRRS